MSIMRTLEKINHIIIRADSRFAPSQWEMMLFCNGISHWLGASLESALMMRWDIVKMFFHVQSHENMMHCNMLLNKSLGWCMLEINLAVYSQKTPHSLPIRASYGVSIVSIFDKNLPSLYETGLYFYTPTGMQCKSISVSSVARFCNKCHYEGCTDVYCMLLERRIVISFCLLHSLLSN